MYTCNNKSRSKTLDLKDLSDFVWWLPARWETESDYTQQLCWGRLASVILFAILLSHIIERPGNIPASLQHQGHLIFRFQLFSDMNVYDMNTQWQCCSVLLCCNCSMFLPLWNLVVTSLETIIQYLHRSLMPSLLISWDPENARHNGQNSYNLSNA